MEMKDFPGKVKGGNPAEWIENTFLQDRGNPLVRQTLNKLSTTETSFLRESKSNRSAGKNTVVAWRLPTAPRKECKGYVFIQPRKPPFRGPAREGFPGAVTCTTSSPINKMGQIP